MTNEQFEKLKEYNAKTAKLLKRVRRATDVVTWTHDVHEEIKTGMGFWKLVDRVMIFTNHTAGVFAMKQVDRSVAVFQQSFSMFD